MSKFSYFLDNNNLANAKISSLGDFIKHLLVYGVAANI